MEVNLDKNTSCACHTQRSKKYEINHSSQLNNTLKDKSLLVVKIIKISFDSKVDYFNVEAAFLPPMNLLTDNKASTTRTVKVNARNDHTRIWASKKGQQISELVTGGGQIRSLNFGSSIPH